MTRKQRITARLHDDLIRAGVCSASTHPHWRRYIEDGLAALPVHLPEPYITTIHQMVIAILGAHSGVNPEGKSNAEIFYAIRNHKKESQT